MAPDATPGFRKSKVVCKVAEKCPEAKMCAHFCWHKPTGKQLSAVALPGREAVRGVVDLIEVPRCEGCGKFVSPKGHHPSDFRWCKRCEDGLPMGLYIRSYSVDRFEAQAKGWPMWPLSDICEAA